MYIMHPDLPPIKLDEKIWHYFSLSKFLGLLRSSSLYLCRQDQFDDTFEGAMSKKDEAFFNQISPGMTNNMKGDTLGCFYSNCWTKSEVDEYVMWNTYASLKDGVAIQTTTLNLISSLDSTDNRHVYVADVQYIDYESDYTFRRTGGKANMIPPRFSKRSYFAAEKELRVLYWDTDGKFDSTPIGLDFKVDLNTLIDSIFVSPNSYPWFRDVVEEVLLKYGIKKEVKRSGI